MTRDVIAKQSITFAFVGLISLGLAGCFGAIGSDGYYKAEEAPSTGDDDGRGKLLKSLLTGAGLQDPNERRVEIKARPPIVMPASKDLPPPVDGRTHVSSVRADWPKDRDAAEQAFRNARRKYEEDNNLRNSVTGRERVVLRGDEVAPGRLPIASKSPKKWDPAANLERDFRMTPSEMKRGHKREIADLKKLDANGVPERKYLIEPPSEYRTPSEKAAFNPEVVIENAEEKQRKSDELMDRSGGRLY